MKIFIYLIKCLINDKCYVGQTINYEKRMKEHIYGRNARNNSLVDRALKKYGKDYFRFSLLDICTNQVDADEKEKYYIKFLNCMKPHGYNVLIGGRIQQGSWNQRRVYMYDLNGNYMKEFISAMEVQRYSNSFYLREGVSSCCNGKANKYKDRIFSYEKKSSLNPYQIAKSSRCKEVYQFSKYGKFINCFESITMASIKTNTSRTSIIGCLKGIYKTANDFIWSYTYKDDLIFKPIQKISVIQYDLQGNILNEYPSCKEAERQLNLKEGSYKNIYKKLDTKYIAYGFRWERKNKDNTVPSLL